MAGDNKEEKKEEKKAEKAEKAEKKVDGKIAGLLEKYEKGALSTGGMDPMDFMVYYIIMDTAECTAAMAVAAIRRMRGSFVDYNDIRVARWTEVADSLKPLPQADPAARRIHDFLNRVFDTCGAMSLRFFTELKLMEAKKTIAALEPALPKETGFPVLYAYLPGFPIAISDAALALARQQGVVARTGTRQNLQKALADSGLPGDKCADLVFYWEIDAVKDKKPAPKKADAPKAAAKQPKKKAAKG
ncbi:MAG: hypothetical protein J6333_00110 [Planctomycetes bacterium]|nr:hypothetical protein [Planctomycetota bacterium]